MRHSSLTRLVFALVAAAILGYGGLHAYRKYGRAAQPTTTQKPPLPRTDPQLAPVNQPAGAAVPALDPTLTAAWTMEDLGATIQPLGEDGTLPTAIRVAFAKPLAPGSTQPVPAGTKITLDPETEGQLTWGTTPAELVFTPAAPLKYGVSYKVTLDAVEIDGRAVLPAAAGQVSRVFQTPAFELKRVSLARVNDKAGLTEFDVVFTGPVEASRLKAFASWTISGGTAGTPEYRTGKAANEVISALPTGNLTGEQTLQFSLKSGMPALADGGGTAPAKVQKVPLFAGKDVTVKAVRLKEGVNGFYIHVICNDGSRWSGADEVYQNRIYYYDNDTHDGMYVSDRCAFDEATARSKIRIKPAAKWSLVPARGGFRILGDFVAGDLSLEIDAGLPSVDGGVLKTPVVETFAVPRRKPSVAFVARGRYLPRDTWKSLGIKHLNVDRAELEVRVVPPENLIFWMSADAETADLRNSNLVVKKDLKLGGKPDEAKNTWIDLAAILGSPPRGVIELSITEKPTGKSVDKKRLVITDINLVAKRGRGGQTVHVWALNMKDGSPLAGVNVRQIVRSGRAISECVTSSSGACMLGWDKQKELDAGAVPFALVASKDSDLTYLRYEDLKTEISEQIVQGRPFSGGATPYRAAVWSDRGAYRPGETAHVTGVVRGQDDLAPPFKDSGMPVELRLFDPREKLVRKLNLEANAVGIVSADLAFASFANTGRYRVTLHAGNAEIGTYSFNVEEFVPERLKVEAVATAPSLLGAEAGTFDVTARYLFGGSAEGSRVELRCELWPGAFTPPENANFAYGVWYPDRDSPKGLPLGNVSGKLDENGKTQLSCPTQAEGGMLAGPARLMARAIVFEGESGRSTQSEAQIAVHPERFYIGLSSGQEKLSRGDTLNFQGVLVDWDGKLILTDEAIEVELVRLETEYDWSWDEGGGDSNYKRFQRQASEGKSTVAVKGGKFEGQFKIAQGGSGFLVRARAKNARTDLSLKGDDNDYYWYPSESGRDQTPRPFKPGWIEVKAPERVQTGEKIKVSFVAPYKGRVLMTAETDEIVASEWRDVAAGNVEWTFPLDRFVPNVYVSVFLVKDPHLESSQSFMPDRSFGVRNVAVDPVNFRHELKLTAPAEIEPNSTLTVDLDLGAKVEGDAYVAVAAVDEGVLSLTRFKTPDPLRAIFQARALGLETYETIGWNVMLPGAGPASHTGGDGAGGDKPITLVKPVALWSGLVKVEKGGKAKVTFEVPQYRGELRVMAVSIDKQRLGSASAQVQVKDPLVLQTTLPRFLTEGDSFNIPVSISNQSGAEQKVKVEVQTAAIPLGGDPESDYGEAVAIEGSKVVEIPLAVGQTQTVVFRARTVSRVGGAKVTIKASAGALASHEELEVPILSAAPKSRIVKRVELAGGEFDVLPHLAGWVPTTESTSLWVTANPYADAFGHLKHLIQYPYGCIEQTTSTMRPLLALKDLLQQADPEMGAPLIEDMVKKGIERMLSMQTPSGGFGYWPGSDNAIPWATAYATHILLDAQKLNYPVPKERIDEALSYLTNTLLNTYRYMGDATEGESDPHDLRGSAPYMHYVLASSGKGLKADMQKLLDDLLTRKKASEEGAEQLYLLKAGLWLAGDRRFEGDLKKPDLTPITPYRRNGWTFYSDLRRRGLLLSVMTDLFGADPAAEPLATLVAERLRAQKSSWYTTQEIVWAVTGLGKFVQGGAKAFDATLKVDGKEEGAPTLAQGGDKSWRLRRASEKNKLSVVVDKKDEGKVYLMLSSEGVRAVPDYRTGGEGLKISRAYRKQDGSPLDPEAEVALGEVIFTELSITNATGDAIENIALVDRFPAAWEIENPRLGRGTAAAFVDQASLWELAYMNIRDDRMELFGALSGHETRKVYYASRAVVSGRFAIPPVEAEAMYDPRIWARENGGKTNVKGPWKEFAGQ